MLNFFKTIHIYIDNDSLFWIYVVNKRVEKKGIYDLKNGLENLKVYFIDVLNVKSLHFIYFKINMCTYFYKVSVLPYINDYLSIDNLKNISNSIFLKKYLNFDENEYQFFCSKQSFGDPIILIALDKNIYNFFCNLNLGRFEFYFDVIEILNKMKSIDSKIFNFNGSYYYYEFYEKKLIDINIFHSNKALRNIEICSFEFDFNIDFLNNDDKVVFPKIMSLLCIK